MSEEINRLMGNVPQFATRGDAITYLERHMPTLPPEDQIKAQKILDDLTHLHRTVSPRIEGEMIADASN